jgi:hypothetical protein
MSLLCNVLSIKTVGVLVVIFISAVFVIGFSMFLDSVPVFTGELFLFVGSIKFFFIQKKKIFDFKTNLPL